MRESRGSWWFARGVEPAGHGAKVAVDLPSGKDGQVSASKRLRVMLADDHTLFRKGNCSLLGEREDIQVVGDVENGQARLTWRARNHRT